MCFTWRFVWQSSVTICKVGNVILIIYKGWENNLTTYIWFDYCNKLQILSMLLYHMSFLSFNGSTMKWLVEQEVPSLPVHLTSPHVVSGVRVVQSFVYCVVFYRSLFYFCTVSFGHCIVCPSSIYGFWLPSGIFQNILMLYPVHT